MKMWLVYLAVFCIGYACGWLRAMWDTTSPDNERPL